MQLRCYYIGADIQLPRATGRAPRDERAERPIDRRVDRAGKRSIEIFPWYPLNTSAPLTLEAADERLIELLIIAGRMAYVDFSTQVELSGVAARNRLCRLIGNEIFQVIDSISAAPPGPDSFALGTLTVDGPRPTRSPSGWRSWITSIWSSRSPTSSISSLNSPVTMTAT